MQVKLSLLSSTSKYFGYTLASSHGHPLRMCCVLNIIALGDKVPERQPDVEIRKNPTVHTPEKGNTVL